MSESTTSTRSSRRKPALIAGALGAVALGLSLSGTLSAFTAQITNSVNTAGVGSLTMQETGPDGKGGTATCTTDATNTSVTCATINKYGGNLAMTTTGATSSSATTIQISNPGSISAASFTLAPGACTLTNPSNGTGSLCDAALVTIVQDGTTIVNGVSPSAMTAAGTYTLAPVAAGATSNITITISTAGADNTMQGQSISQPLTWTFNA